MAENIFETNNNDQKIVLLTVLLASLNAVRMYNLPKNRIVLEKLMTLGYNTFVFNFFLSQQAIESYISRCEKEELLLFTASEIELIPLSVNQVTLIHKDQKIFRFLLDMFFDKMLTIAVIEPERILNIAYNLAYQYRLFVDKSELVVDTIALLTPKAKEYIIQETWKDLHEDFDFMYDVLSENDFIYRKIRETFFDTLEYLYLMHQFLQQNSKIVEDRL